MSNRSETRRVLVIASAFPPAGGSGVQRTAKFVKYLPACGWTPVVWTCDHHSGLPSDATLLEDLPDDLEIHRHGGGWNGLAPTLLESLGRCASRTGLLGAAARRLDWRLRARQAQSNHPDGSIGWANAGLRPILDLIARDNVDAIYSTFSPASNHLLALRVREATGLPWIADFRDLWTDDYRYRPATLAVRAADRRLEQEILEAADVVIGVSPNQTAILASHVPQQRNKFATITNGFDPADFDRDEDCTETSCDERPFVLAHVGRFDRWRTPEAWFDGLSRFVAMLGAARDTFELRIVGHVDRRTSARLDQTGVQWVHMGEALHDEAIRQMRRADALLLSVPEGPNADSVIPAKLFEYLAAGRPMLVVGPEDGVAEGIVQSQGAGVTVNFDADDITFALDRLYSGRRNGEPARTAIPGQLDRFSRITLTRHLAALLDDLVCPVELCDAQSSAAKELQLS